MDEKKNEPKPNDLKSDKQLWENILNGNDNDPEALRTEEEKKRSIENIYININTYEQKRKLRRFRSYTAAAVITLVFIVAGIMGYNNFIKPDVYYAKTQNVTVKLADGSTITLLKGAELTVEKSFPSNTRDVQLKGDAIFKVSKSKEHPFIVHGKDYDTKVLGTVFKVVQSGETFSVDLYEGKVLVNRATKPAERFILKPKQTFTNFGIAEAATVFKTPEKPTNGVFVQTDIEADPVTITFNECSVKNAVKVIEESYGVSVTYPKEYEDQKISVTHYNASAMKLLETIALQLNLTIKDKNDTQYQLEK